jgi:DNA-binding transcriptional regulator YiaG
MTFAEQLRAWRRGKKLTQRLAAQRLRVPLRTIENWEQGIHVPSHLARREVEAVMTRARK